MRSLILSMMVSVDGYIEGENRELDWHVWDDGLERHMTQFFTTVDTMIFGRVAYELMISYWPTATDSIAPQMNTLPKLILSIPCKLRYGIHRFSMVTLQARSNTSSSRAVKTL